MGPFEDWAGAVAAPVRTDPALIPESLTVEVQLDGLTGKWKDSDPLSDAFKKDFAALTNIPVDHIKGVKKGKDSMEDAHAKTPIKDGADNGAEKRLKAARDHPESDLEARKKKAAEIVLCKRTAVVTNSPENEAKIEAFKASWNRGQGRKLEWTAVATVTEQDVPSIGTMKIDVGKDPGPKGEGGGVILFGTLSTLIKAGGKEEADFRIGSNSSKETPVQLAGGDTALKVVRLGGGKGECVMPIAVVFVVVRRRL